MAAGSKKLTDPLSSVKLQDPTATPTPAPSAPVAVTEVIPIVPEPPKVPAARPVYVARHRVTEMRRLSYKGQMITLRKGKIVSDATHGPGFVDHLKQSGVILELVE